MSDLIIEAVARRWKQASESTWLTDSEEIDLDSALGYFREATRLIKGYKAKCAYLVPIYQKLAEPLEAPSLAKYADLITKRVIEVDQLMVLLSDGVKMLKKAQGEFDKLLVNLASDEPHQGGFIERVYGLPTIVAIMKLAKEAGKIHDKLTTEDDDGLIDWTLEEYLGPGAGIQKKIERTGEPMRGWFAGGSDFTGAGILYGFVKYLADPKFIQDNVEQIRVDRGAEV